MPIPVFCQLVVGGVHDETAKEVGPGKVFHAVCQVGQHAAHHLRIDVLVQLRGPRRQRFAVLRLKTTMSLIMRITKRRENIEAMEISEHRRLRQPSSSNSSCRNATIALRLQTPNIKLLIPDPKPQTPHIKKTQVYQTPRRCDEPDAAGWTPRETARAGISCRSSSWARAQRCRPRPCRRTAAGRRAPSSARTQVANPNPAQPDNAQPGMARSKIWRKTLTASTEKSSKVAAST